MISVNRKHGFERKMKSGKNWPCYDSNLHAVICRSSKPGSRCYCDRSVLCEPISPDLENREMSGSHGCLTSWHNFWTEGPFWTNFFLKMILFRSSSTWAWFQRAHALAESSKKQSTSRIWFWAAKILFFPKKLIVKLGLLLLLGELFRRFRAASRGSSWLNLTKYRHEPGK